MNLLEKIQINNSEQWVLIRSKKADAPLLIHVQAGPGLPMIAEADTMQNMLKLEDNFIVAYWDQRACGKSYYKEIDPKTITLDQLADDVLACTHYLLKKFKKEKAVLVGYSIGATIGLMAAAKDSTPFEQLFLVGIDIDLPFANSFAAEFALKKSKQINNASWIAQAERLSRTPITTSALFQQRAKLLTNLGGIKTGSNYNQLLTATIANMIWSKAYRWSDIIKTIKGMEFCQNALLSEMNTLNLFDRVSEVNTNVHFIHGKLDGVAPYETTVQFYEHLSAPKKSFTGFEFSAHMPHYEEPERFSKLITSIWAKNQAEFSYSETQVG